MATNLNLVTLNVLVKSTNSIISMRFYIGKNAPKTCSCITCMNVYGPEIKVFTYLSEAYINEYQL